MNKKLIASAIAITTATIVCCVLKVSKDKRQKREKEIITKATVMSEVLERCLMYELIYYTHNKTRKRKEVSTLWDEFKEAYFTQYTNKTIDIYELEEIIDKIYQKLQELYGEEKIKVRYNTNEYNITFTHLWYNTYNKLERVNEIIENI